MLDAQSLFVAYSLTLSPSSVYIKAISECKKLLNF